MYAGSGQTHTLQLMLKQSPLIEIFRSVHVLIEENFHMLHRSVRHARPDTTMTIKILCDVLHRHCAYEQKGRKDVNKLLDHRQEGTRRIQTEKIEMSEGRNEGMNEADNDYEHREGLEMDDLEV